MRFCSPQSCPAVGALGLDTNSLLWGHVPGSTGQTATSLALPTWCPAHLPPSSQPSLLPKESPGEQSQQAQGRAPAHLDMPWLATHR